MIKKTDRDIEKQYSIKETVNKLRRMADCLESGKPFLIQIAGERITVPARAVFTIEHEREGYEEEVEFQFKWETKIEDFAKLLVTIIQFRLGPKKENQVVVENFGMFRALENLFLKALVMAHAGLVRR